jgi:uncharacterized membrane protein
MNPELSPDDPDLDNPYAPPRSALVPKPAPEPLAGIPFSVGDVFNWSWALFKERTWPCIFIFWGPMVIYWALALGLTMLEESLLAAVRDPSFFFVLRIASRVVAIVVQVWLGIGMNRGLLRVARREPVSFAVIFTGGGPLVTVVLAGILVGVLILLPLGTFAGAIATLLLALRRMESVSMFVSILACGGLGLALVLYLSARLMQFYFLAIDRNAGVFQSIQWSWQLTRGRSATVILVYLLQVCVGLAGLLACCVGVIIALPVSSMLAVVTYLALAEPAKPLGEPPPIAWIEEV